MDNNIHIFTGHFGSGKTEVALNYALLNANKNKDVTIVDMDIVNSYFRTKDAENILKSHGIKTIASVFASSNIDIPIVPGNIFGMDDENSITILDVGGDSDGAFALGRYKSEIEKRGYQMHFVINTKRPNTQNAEDIIEYINEIEYASRLSVTDLINNTNLGVQTDEDTLLSGIDEIEKVSKKKGIPISMYSGTKKAVSNINTDIPMLNMDIFIKMPWQNDN